jgi:hypothetical protein
MKKVFFGLVVFIASISILATSNQISSFRAFSSGNNITIEWKTNDETNIRQFELQRSSNNSVYTKIQTFNANSKPYDYKYIDEDALFKASQTDPKVQEGKVFSYRLKIIFNDGNSDYSDAITVTYSTNSIKRTWGMIKELFR